MENIVISKGPLELTLCPPSFEEGYYRGTRFDHSGIFRKIVHGGFVLVDEWFDEYDPYKHDAVCGNSEEYDPCGYETAPEGAVFFKPGVGLLLKEKDEPFGRFKLYKVADPGKWTVTNNEDKVVFVHVVDSDDWGYIYEKVVRIIDENTFEISHRLCNSGSETILGQTFNHNFFTFGGACPGPDMQIDFPFRPCGHWRDKYDSVALSESGIRYSRCLKKDETVFMGDLNPSDGLQVTGLLFTQTAGGRRVDVYSDVPFDHIVFWSNPRVGCVEPFISYNLKSGDEFEWTYRYSIVHENKSL